MNVFTKRNALVGWITTRIARRKAKRGFRGVLARANRHRLALGTGAVAVATGLAVTAVAARRSHAEDPRPA